MTRRRVRPHARGRAVLGAAAGAGAVLALALAGLAGCATEGESSEGASGEEAAGSEGAAESEGAASDGGNEDAAGPAGAPEPADVPDEAEGWPTDDVVLTGPDGATVPLHVWVADDQDRRAVGLMGWSHLPEGTGMLFEYPASRDGGFWMKGVRFPLSIAFADDAGTVTEIIEMDVCDDDPCPVHEPEGQYRRALELPQGRFQEHGVEPGWQLEVRG
ncbi:DUF192 domain-containing protein [Egibacter rhizosphaerae]|uniref:DUF192 domain-containing protein n=1 Tax=Egibacter rhizosphaerae TaxID=1670831 RepID=A0A411YG26_9ACTN|nr:DUF192 domain-containing protein [Egibacter rhizosphaerae]QBI20146.1 DUF192 domain-containing protein [Egibacter rhizosphaerae]